MNGKRHAARAMRNLDGHYSMLRLRERGFTVVKQYADCYLVSMGNAKAYWWPITREYVMSGKNRSGEAPKPKIGVRGLIRDIWARHGKGLR